MSNKTLGLYTTWARAYYSYIKKGWWPFLDLVFNEIKCSLVVSSPPLYQTCLLIPTEMSGLFDWCSFHCKNVFNAKLTSETWLRPEISASPEMHSDLEGDILLPARYMACIFSLTGAGVHITQQTFCFFFSYCSAGRPYLVTSANCAPSQALSNWWWWPIRR